jgi:hypothetical protein
MNIKQQVTLYHIRVLLALLIKYDIVALAHAFFYVESKLFVFLYESHTVTLITWSIKGFTSTSTSVTMILDLILHAMLPDILKHMSSTIANRT